MRQLTQEEVMPMYAFVSESFPCLFHVSFWREDWGYRRELIAEAEFSWREFPILHSLLFPILEKAWEENWTSGYIHEGEANELWDLLLDNGVALKDISGKPVVQAPAVG